MAWSSVHRGDFTHMRRGLTQALLEAEAMEPRIQLAYARGEVPSDLAANMGLVRLLLERADALTHLALDVAISDTSKYHEIYADVTYSDRQLAESA